MYASYSPAPRTNTWQPAGGEGYWPTGLLEAFTLQMASHGHSVSSSMMMGDRRYALTGARAQPGRRLPARPGHVAVPPF